MVCKDRVERAGDGSVWVRGGPDGGYQLKDMWRVGILVLEVLEEWGS